jgi:CubicO group peptidase (beta-lactamase class C family)
VPGVHDGVFSANGAYGQVIYVNPGEQVVAAIQSARRRQQDPDAGLETVMLLRAAISALRPASS